MNLQIRFSVEMEVERIKNTLAKMSWYQAHGYRPYIPEEINEINTEDEIRDVVAKQYDPAVYESIAQVIKWKFTTFGERFIGVSKQFFPKNIPETIDIRLTQYGVSGSYNLPNIIVFKVDGNDRVKTIFHELIHLFIEPLIQEFHIEQWEKERIVDLTLHSEPFAFLEYTTWQRDYHDVQIYIDPLFQEQFFKDTRSFFRSVIESQNKNKM